MMDRPVTRVSTPDDLLHRRRYLVEVLLVCCLIFTMVTLVYDNLVWQGRVLHAGDVWMQYYPAKAYAYAFMRQGQLPLWTPNLAFGYPLFAEAQAGMLYPVHLALTPFSTSTAYSLSVIIRYILGGVFMFLYARRIIRNSWAAVLSGLVFSCSGYMIAQVPHENVENALIWLPLILLLLDKWITESNRRALFGAGLSMGISFLAGYFYISLLILTTATSYYLYFSLIPEGGEQTVWKRLKSSRVSGGLILFGFLGVGLACVQLLPNYELAQESTRMGGLDYKTSTQVSFPPFNMVCFVFAKFFGHPSLAPWHWGLWKGNYIDLVIYLGVLPFLFLLAALIVRRDKYTLFFGALFLLALGLAFGQFSPLWYIWNKLPVFSMMRNPARFLSLIMTAGALLAGLGMDTLMRATLPEEKRRLTFIRMLRIGTSAVMILALTGSVLIASFRPGLLKLAHWFIDSFVYNQSIHQHSREYYYGMVDLEFDKFLEIIQLTHPFFYPSLILVAVSTLVILWLVARPRSGMVVGFLVLALVASDLLWFAKGYNYELPPDAYDQKRAYFNLMEQDTSVFRYTNAPLDISLRNYDPLLFNQMGIQVKSPLQMSRQVTLIETLRPFMSNLAEVTAPHPLINLLNIKYIVTTDSLSEPWAKLRYNKGERVYENQTVLPRAFIAPYARILPTQQEVLQNLADSTFRPQETVLLESEPAFVPSVANPPTRLDQAVITSYKNDTVDIDVETNGGFLVLTDTYYPGWRAYVDGVEQPILRANYLFRAVPLQSGRHQVSFVYKPLSFRIGLIVTLMSLVIGCALLAMPQKSLV